MRIFSLLLLIMFLTSCKTANNIDQNELNAIVKQAKGKYTDTGIVVGIIKNGKKNYYSSGSRSLEDNKKLDEYTIFEVGSATKTVTGLLLAKEIEEGNFRRAGFIDAYLPNDISLPIALKNKVKLTDLASHQSGLPNLSNDHYFEELLERDGRNPFRFVDQKYLYDVLKETKELKDYGSYQYNNFAYSLLGAFLEEKTNVSFEHMVQQQILQPLKMTYSSFDIPTNVENKAGLYAQRGEPQEFLILKSANAAGGLKSNAVDLLKYLGFYLSGQKTDKAIQLTQIPYFQNSEKKIGLGWEIKDDYFEKDGDTFGNSCLIRYTKDGNLGIVVLSNHQNGQLVRDIMSGIYQKVRN